MKEELVSLQQKITIQIKTISDLELAHDKVKQEMEQMTTLLAARETDIVNLQDKKEEYFHQQLSKELTESKQENDKLKEQITALQISKVVIDKEIQTLASSDETTTIEELQKKFEQLQLEHVASETDLQSQVSKKEETIISLREQLQQLTETLQLSESTGCQSCSRLMKQVEPLEERVAVMEKENNELTEEIRRLQDDHVTTSEVVTTEKNQLQSELAKCSKELERLKTHLLQVRWITRLAMTMFNVTFR